MATAWSQMNRDGVLTVKTTVRPDGSIVGRNFQGPGHRDKLRPGEIGIKMIIDPSLAEDALSDVLPDAQYEVLRKVREDLGLSSDRFEKGVVVSIAREGTVEFRAIVLRDDGDLLRVRYFGLARRLVRRTVSLHSHEIEEVLDCFGVAGLIEALFTANIYQLPTGFIRYNQRPEFLVEVLKRKFVRDSGADRKDPRVEVLEHVATLEDRSPYLAALISRVITRESKEFDLAEQAFALIPADDEESMLTIATKTHHPNLKLTAIERVDESRRAEFYPILASFAGGDGAYYSKSIDAESRALVLIPDSQVELLCDLARGRSGVLRSRLAASRLTVEFIKALPEDSLADLVALMRAAHCSSHPDAKVHAVRRLSSLNLAEFDGVVEDVQYLEKTKLQCLTEVLLIHGADQAVQLEAVGLFDLDEVDDFFQLLNVAMGDQPRQALIKRWLSISPLEDWVEDIDKRHHIEYIAQALDSLEELKMLWGEACGYVVEVKDIRLRYAELGGDTTDLKEEEFES